MHKSKAFRNPFKRYYLQDVTKLSKPRKLAIFKVPIIYDISTLSFPV